MSRGCTLSILGLYEFNNKLFDEMSFPSKFTQEQKDTVIKNILIESADLECAFPNWDVLKVMIGTWSKLNLPTWERIYNASLLEYNPIENYNRNETETINTTGKEQTNDSDRFDTSGKDSTSSSQSHFGSDTTKGDVTAYDSNSMKPHDESKITYGHNITDNTQISYGKADTRTRVTGMTNSEDVTRTNKTTGNIGVTTSQQMLMSEKEIALEFNLLPAIVKSFIERFCILVY